MRIKFVTALALAVPFSAITILLVSLVVKARANKVTTGDEGMIGETGVATSELAPDGMVFVRGEYWKAVSAQPLAARNARAGDGDSGPEAHGGADRHIRRL